MGALNGHDTVTFDGLNQYGSTIIPNILQPYTIYIVARQITFPGFSFYLTDDGVNPVQNGLITWLTDNEFLLGSSTGMIFNPNFVLNTFQVITYQVNGINSSLKVNLTNSVIGDIGHNLACDGITIASAVTGIFNLNCEFAYIIMRDNADNTLTQNNIINWLKNRFAI